MIHDIQHLYLDRQVAGAKADYHREHMDAALELLVAGLRVPDRTARTNAARHRIRRRPARPD